MPQPCVTAEPRGVHNRQIAPYGVQPGLVEVLSLIQVDIQELIRAGLPGLTPGARCGIEALGDFDAHLKER